MSLACSRNKEAIVAGTQWKRRRMKRNEIGDTGGSRHQGHVGHHSLCFILVAIGSHQRILRKWYHPLHVVKCFLPLTIVMENRRGVGVGAKRINARIQLRHGGGSQTRIVAAKMVRKITFQMFFEFESIGLTDG